MAVTLIFTVFAIAYRKTEFYVIDAVLWFVASAIHFYVGDLNSVLTATIPWMYVGVGWVFIVLGFVTSLQGWQNKKKRQQEELP
jgi:hypothetical protein